MSFFHIAKTHSLLLALLKFALSNRERFFFLEGEIVSKTFLLPFLKEVLKDGFSLGLE
ncbi:hypothetical protein O6H91_07G090300 [Diphasiastrum complanatum]|uniref:Uncharacterized protein n=1 Tax=Diphasiastrum complanatum TaxID=34168 RepID=A0ACC2D8J3_DIPCM|nr:hypothetical protein O6H91_07G090300 [Diphasiastrum complanatum]